MLLSGWIDSSGWVHCPVCGNKTRTKVNRDTVLKRFPLFCPKCGHEHIFTTALNSANESSVVIPLNYRNEYAVFNNEVIESYTFNSIPNHVDVAAIKLK